MEKVSKQLKWLFWGLAAAIAMLIVVHEADVVAVGAWTGNGNTEFMVLTLMELLTVALIPCALYLFKMRAVKAQLAVGGSTSWRRWACVRLLMIGVPAVANTALYYLFMNASFGYMAIIGLLVMPFVYPSETRCRQELEPDGREDEPAKPEITEDKTEA